MAFTPGPNNVMLASSGANFGLRSTVPHICGITLGFPVMLALVGYGMASLSALIRVLEPFMRVVSFAYLLWLAWKIFRADAVRVDRGAGPMTFIQAAAFQWINPKAWIIAIGAVSTYTSGAGPRFALQVGIICFITLFVTMASSTSWSIFGQTIGNLLHDTKRRRVYNSAMAVLLVISVLPVTWDS